MPTEPLSPADLAARLREEMYDERRNGHNEENLVPVSLLESAVAHLERLAELELPAEDLDMLLERFDRSTKEMQRKIVAASVNRCAEAFKKWTHDYLDAKGIPHHPPGTHGAAGCRIGDRMDYVFAELDRLREPLTEETLAAVERLTRIRNGEGVGQAYRACPSPHLAHIKDRGLLSEAFLDRLSPVAAAAPPKLWHYGSHGQAECGANKAGMSLTTVKANVTCPTCRGWLPIIETELTDPVAAAPKEGG